MNPTKSPAALALEILTAKDAVLKLLAARRTRGRFALYAALGDLYLCHYAIATKGGR